MDKKTIISILIIFAGITALVMWSKSVDSKVVSDKAGTVNSNLAKTGGLNAGALNVSEKLYDFGTISMENGKVSKVFTVSNSTNEDILVPSLSTSCMCTNAYIVNEDGSKKGPFGMPGHGGSVPKANVIVKAGENLSVEVVYDPNAHGPAGVGPIDRFVYLEDANGNKIELEIKANVKP